MNAAPGVKFWRENFSHTAQQTLYDVCWRALEMAPLYRPGDAGVRQRFSVEESISVPWAGSPTKTAIAISHPSPNRQALAGDSAHTYCVVARHRRRRRLQMLPGQSLLCRAPAWACTRTKIERSNRRRLSCRCRWGMKLCFVSAAPTRRGPTQSVPLSSGDVVMFGGPRRGWPITASTTPGLEAHR